MCRKTNCAGGKVCHPAARYQVEVGRTPIFYPMYRHSLRQAVHFCARWWFLGLLIVLQFAPLRAASGSCSFMRGLLRRSFPRTRQESSMTRQSGISGYTTFAYCLVSSSRLLIKLVAI